MKKVIGLLVLVVAFATATFSFTTTKKDTPQLVKDDVVQIKFSGLSYADALKLSEQTGKLIFIDCYTVWCGPCKYLSNTTFKDKEVAEFFNANFINLKVEMEKDADGPELARLFKVRGYPTMLFLNEKGELIQQVYGYADAAQLMNVATKVVK